jgi:transposase
VHARSVVADVLDVGSGELRTRRMPVRTEETVGWLQSLPGAVRVAYEAGPTGYGLARACLEAGSCARWRHRRGSGGPRLTG